jgi:hypothetical protein
MGRQRAATSKGFVGDSQGAAAVADAFDLTWNSARRVGIEDGDVPRPGMVEKKPKQLKLRSRRS